MSDFDLDNSLRDDFDSHPFEEPTNDKWTRLEAGLDERDARQQRRRRLVAGWLPTFLGALLVGLLCWQWQLSDLRAERLELRVAQLEAAVEQCRSLEKQAAFAEKEEAGSDAGSNKGSIENGFPNENTAAKSSVWHGANSQSGGQFFTKSTIPGNRDFNKNLAFSAVNANENLRNDLTDDHAFAPEKTGILQGDSLSHQLTFVVPDKLPEKPLQAFLSEAAPNFQRVNSAIFDNDLMIVSARQLQKSPRERRWAVGFGVGHLFTSQPDLPDFGGSNSSVNLMFSINEKWRLMGSIEASDLSFSTKTPLLSEVPAPPSPDDEFLRLEGAIQEESYALGARRQFRPTKQIQPLISAEWVGINRISTKRDYLFTPANSPSSTLKISDEDKNPQFNGNNLRLTGGASWKILRWLEWNAQVGFMNEQFKKDTRVDIGISTRFLFLF